MRILNGCKTITANVKDYRENPSGECPLGRNIGNGGNNHGAQVGKDFFLRLFSFSYR